MPTHRFLATGCALSVQTLLLAQFVLLAMVEPQGGGARTQTLSLYSIAAPEAVEAKPAPEPPSRKVEAAASVSPLPASTQPATASAAVSPAPAPSMPVMGEAGAVPAVAGTAEASGMSGMGGPTSGETTQPGHQLAVSRPIDAGVQGAARGVRDRYAALIAAWLERHKAYPAELAARGDGGVVCVRFRIDALGRVRELTLVRGSGMALLDRLALAQVAAAAPFPRPPAGLEEGERRFEVPLRYRPRG